MGGGERQGRAPPRCGGGSGCSGDRVRAGAAESPALPQAELPQLHPCPWAGMLWVWGEEGAGSGCWAWGQQEKGRRKWVGGQNGQTTHRCEEGGIVLEEEYLEAEQSEEEQVQRRRKGKKQETLHTLTSPSICSFPMAQERCPPTRSR